MDTDIKNTVRSKGFIIGVIALVILVGLGFIFRPYPGTVAGVNTTTPNVPNETTGTLSGTVRAP